MTTAANTRRADSSHWYHRDGQPCYKVPYADPKKGFRPTTLSDARKLDLLPSVTTILKVLHRQALVDWLVEQAVLAVLTTPRNEGEDTDAFVYRVLHGERVQDQESQAARDRGTEMHAGIESLFRGDSVSEDLLPWILPAYSAIMERGKIAGVEVVVVGQGYAGKLDLQQETQDTLWLWDWKTAKRLPDPAKGGAWSDHRLQLSAYAAASFGEAHCKEIRTGNVYISTVEKGKFVICEHAEPWQQTYTKGFEPLIAHWQWATGYHC